MSKRFFFLTTLYVFFVLPPVIAQAKQYTSADIDSCNQRFGEQSLRSCSKMAESGNTMAMFTLSIIYAEGKGIAVNNGESFKWALKAALAGESKSWMSVGLKYLKGSGTEKNLDQAKYWLRKAAETGAAPDQLQYGLHLVYGFGGFPINKVEGLAWMEKSAEQGLALAQNSLFLAILENMTPENDRYFNKWWPRIQLSNDKIILNKLGILYLFGEKKVPADLTKAKSFYLRAIDAGNTDAMFNYATYFLLFPRDGSFRDLTLARSYLTKAWADRDIATGLSLAGLDIYEGKAAKNPTAFRSLLEQVWVEFENQCITADACKEKIELFNPIKLLAIAREAGFGGPINIDGAKAIYAVLKKNKISGTESPLSNNNPWKYQDNRHFLLKSLYTDNWGMYTQEQREKLGISYRREISSSSTLKQSARPILEFDINIFFEKSLLEVEDKILDHFGAAAEILKSCDVRLRKARIWSADSYASLEKIRNMPQPLINIFFQTQALDAAVGLADRQYKTVQMTWNSVSMLAGPKNLGSAQSVLAHELGHVFGLPHPNRIDSSVMQYGTASGLSDHFTKEECDQLRMHELLSSADTDMPSALISLEHKPNVKAAKAPTKQPEINIATTQRYEAAFTDLRNLLLINNVDPFSRYTLRALASKHDIAWSEVINLLQLAINWRPEKTFSANRDFKPGLAPDLSGLAKLHVDTNNEFNLSVERILAERRVSVNEATENTNLTRLRHDKLRINLQAGQILDQEQHERTSYSWGLGTLIDSNNIYLIDQKTRIIFYAQAGFINLVANENKLEIWTPRNDVSDKKVLNRQLEQLKRPHPPISLPQTKYGNTPLTIPGGNAITPEELVQIFQAAAKSVGPTPLVLAASKSNALGLPTFYDFSTYKPAKGAGDFNDPIQKQLEEAMIKMNIPKNQLIVTYSSEMVSWEGYNLALRLIALGFTNVNWMREGRDGWILRDYPLTLVGG